MKTITEKQIKDAVAGICKQANLKLPDDVYQALKTYHKNETWPLAQESLQLLEDNLEIADREQIPICQDTGAACVFVELGNDVHIDGDLYAAINEGVKEAYEVNYFRKSIVGDPIRRGNTGTNTPAFISLELKQGDSLKLTVMPKGFGSENMSRLGMLKPSDGEKGVLDFIVETVKLAGPNPCPPIVIGVGVGGSFDKVAYLAKKALMRPIGEANKDPYYADLEKQLLERINALGIGPQGFGGRTTCLNVAIEQYPTHVAGLPVAVNVSCHATRRASVVL